MKCDGTLSKGHLTGFLAKDTTCISCKNCGHFTRLCKSRSKNVNNVDSQLVHNSD